VPRWQVVHQLQMLSESAEIEMRRQRGETLSETTVKSAAGIDYALILEMSWQMQYIKAHYSIIPQRCSKLISEQFLEWNLSNQKNKIEIFECLE
jgi:hypothetical protein